MLFIFTGDLNTIILKEIFRKQIEALNANLEKPEKLCSETGEALYVSRGTAAFLYFIYWPALSLFEVQLQVYYYGISRKRIIKAISPFYTG